MADTVRTQEHDLTRVCSWCGGIVYQGLSAVRTHGICVRCLTRELTHQREEARRRGRAAHAPAADEVSLRRNDSDGT